MAFNHRKLSLICESYCDPIRKPKGRCPISCVPLCPLVCPPPVISPPVIPPPNPLPPAANAAASGSHPVNKLHLLLIISLSILAAACFAFCCFTFYKFYKSRPISRRRRSLQQQQDEGTHDVFLDADHGPVLDHPIWYIRTVGLQPHLINSITVFKYKRGDGLVEGTECSVCLNEFQDDETLRLLPKCNHAFHIPCIDMWLRSHTNCPLCRAGIVSNAAAAASFPGPVPEQSVDNPVAVEEAPVVVMIQESLGELTRERDDPGLEEENETRVENGGNGPETLKEEAAVDEVQPMRRSVSLDSLSASMISAAMANAHLRESAGDYSSAAKLEKVKELNTSIVPKKVDVNQGLARLVGGGGSSIGRSLSCSGKVFLSRYTRRRNSLLPS